MREGWERVSLESLISHIIGGAWGKASGESDVEVIAFGTKAFVGGASILSASTGTLRSVSRSQYAKRELSDGDIILEVSGGSNTQAVGRVLYVDSDMPFVIPSSFMRLLRFDQTRILPRFAFLVLQWLYQSGQSAACQSNTTGIRNLNVPAYLGTSVALPSLDEQRRIVDLIGALDETIESLADVKNQVVQLARAARQGFFTQGDRSVPVGSVYEISAGKQLQSKVSIGSLRPYLRAGNIEDGLLNLSVMKEMHLTDAEMEKLALLDGDVVIVEGGNGYGKSAVWRGTGHAVAFQNHVLRVRPRTDGYSTDYASQWARWCHEQGHFKPTGSGIPNIGLRKAQAMPISVFDESMAPALGALIAMDEQTNIIQDSLFELRALRSSTLTALLSGEHEIPKSYDDVMEVAA